MYLPNPSAMNRMQHKVNSLSRGLNSEFSFSETSCRTKVKEPSLPNYLPIAGGRIIWCILFSGLAALGKMQTSSPRIWTQAIWSISYDDNPYTTSVCMSVCINLYCCVCIFAAVVCLGWCKLDYQTFMSEFVSHWYPVQTSLCYI